MAKTSKEITEEYFWDNCTRDNLRRLLKQEKKQEQERITKIIEETKERIHIYTFTNPDVIKFTIYDAEQELDKILSQIQKVEKQPLSKGVASGNDLE